MGRKSKVLFEQKIEEIENYLCGNKSAKEIIKELNITESYFYQLVRKFKLNGAAGLQTVAKKTPHI